MTATAAFQHSVPLGYDPLVFRGPQTSLWVGRVAMAALVPAGLLEWETGWSAGAGSLLPDSWTMVANAPDTFRYGYSAGISAPWSYIVPALGMMALVLWVAAVIALIRSDVILGGALTAGFGAVATLAGASAFGGPVAYVSSGGIGCRCPSAGC